MDKCKLFQKQRLTSKTNFSPSYLASTSPQCPSLHMHVQISSLSSLTTLSVPHLDGKASATPCRCGLGCHQRHQGAPTLAGHQQHPPPRRHPPLWRHASRPWRLAQRCQPQWLTNFYHWVNLIAFFKMMCTPQRRSHGISYHWKGEKEVEKVGFHSKACTESFFGTNARALEEEVLKKVDVYEKMLSEIAQRCEDEGIDIKVKVTAGTPIRKVILQEVLSCKASWVILDRHLRKDMKFYERNVPCKIAMIEDSFSVEVIRSKFISTSDVDVLEQKLSYSFWKTVETSSSMSYNINSDSTDVSSRSFSTITNSQETIDATGVDLSSLPIQKTQEDSLLVHELGLSSKQDETKKPILCAGCGLRTVLYIKQSMRFSYSEIRAATSDFSMKNLLGEGGFGHVYKGRLQDGCVIAAKVRKAASSQGFTEFRSELQILSFARHRNIVMLLGYCIQEKQNIVVYEYICNKSLDWHLLNKSAPTLEWHKRHAIAIGIAKGLRFLHEECRGGPIIHRDLRPSNILLTHDFVPMLGDFGLAKWKTSVDEHANTRVLGTLGYLAPEYAEYGFVSVRTDVYAYGIVLLQLITGRKVINDQEGQHRSLLQWAEPLLGKLALHELIDPRITEPFDMYELYHMAKVAYLCISHQAEMRPSMGEVVCLLEGGTSHDQNPKRQFMPYYMSS